MTEKRTTGQATQYQLLSPGSMKDSGQDASPETSNGEFLFRRRDSRPSVSTYGTMPQLDMSQSQPITQIPGETGGTTLRKFHWFNSWAKTMSPSTLSCSLGLLLERARNGPFWIKSAPRSISITKILNFQRGMEPECSEATSLRFPRFQPSLGDFTFFLLDLRTRTLSSDGKISRPKSITNWLTILVIFIREF